MIMFRRKKIGIASRLALLEGGSHLPDFQLQDTCPDECSPAKAVQSNLFRISIAMNVLLSMVAIHYQCESITSASVTWHGGHPLSVQKGSCLCGSADGYCMCTPSLAIDLVIHTAGDDVWLVRRKDTSQLATMGGFVNVGETAESAVARELREEMGIVVSSQMKLRLLGLYSDPRRDNRRHTVSAVYAVHLDGSEKPKAADDVKQVQRIPMAEIDTHEFFADHKTILVDYRKWWQSLSEEEQAQAYISDPMDDSRATGRSTTMTGAKAGVSRALC